MTKKNQLQAQIIIYKKRREAIRAEYPNWHTVSNPDYNKRVAVINTRIKLWKRAIKRIEVREKKIKEIAALVCDFMEIRTIRHTSSNKKRVYTDAKKLFCKYAIENGCGNNTMAEYLGTDSKHLYQIRKRFNKSFKMNIYSRELWHRFKLFVADMKEDKQAA